MSVFRPISVAGFTSTGCVRNLNEDRASVEGVRLVTDNIFATSLVGEKNLLLIADGMGGHARGDIASDLALTFLESHKTGLMQPDQRIDVIRNANRSIFAAGLANPQWMGMGATVVGALVSSQSASWFNLGDSRAYLFRDHRLQQLSQDHVPSYATGMGRKRSHAVSQSLGGTRYPTDVWPAIGSLEMRVGDRLLLCSDGLTDVVDDREIGVELDNSADASNAVERLVSKCLSRGAPDNVTVLLATWGTGTEHI